MKKQVLIATLFVCTLSVIGQNKKNKYGITSGAYIQHYNGNLGNSFFKFNTTCFAGSSTTFGMYLNKSFDVNVGGSIGNYGYCQTASDASRVVSLEQRCPGCKDRLGMGELRSLMISGNVSVKYKFANDIFLKENSKWGPYVYAGAGINHLSDNMKRQCVNVGNHITINGGAGIKYNINEKFNISYNLGIGYFVTKKVYYTNATVSDSNIKDADDLKVEKRKDLYMQNTLSLGINF